MKSTRRSLGRVAMTAGVLFLVWRWWKRAGRPPLPGAKTVSTACTDTDDTAIGRAVVALARSHPAESGVCTLPDGRDAFAARVRLADAAERTLDAQYYLWHGDLSGTLLFTALRRAADRGVRVRLLLDDNNTAGLDPTLAALEAHSNIEVRLFNPFFRFRRWRLLGFLTDFARLNRRMHNKSFTADNQATVVGGRNVGDEYFGAGQGALFVDLDVLAVGPVVREVSRNFDRYWASPSAYPVRRVLPAADTATRAGVAAAAERVAQSSAASAYIRTLTGSGFVERLRAGELAFEWAAVRMVSDDPSKGLGRATDDHLLWEQLRRTVGTPMRTFRLVSAYFVPKVDGRASLVALAKRGVKIAVLTNALEATDVAAVHAGYAKRRKALLRAGATLYEMKRTSTAVPTAKRHHPVRSVGSSGASSLHAKTFSVDGARVFVGSFNFDPRSARLNTEMGFIIDSPALARQLEDAIQAHLPDRAYSVCLNAAGALRWVEYPGDGEIVHAGEPGTGLWRRAGVAALSWLPIDWLL